MKIRVTRAYEKPEKEDGTRILVNRLWPRGLTKSKAVIDIRLKEMAPSTKLRKCFGHDSRKAKEFAKRYRRELRDHPEHLECIRQKARTRTVTLVYAARDVEQNNAVPLKQVLEET